MTDAVQTKHQEELPVTRGEILAWASYDIANSTYATVIATALYNAYFVHTIVGSGANTPHAKAFGTLLLTVVIAISSVLVVISAPLLGTLADATASKKKILLISTLGCITAVACLSQVGPGQYIAGMILLVVANFCFGTGEDFIASFLPELAPREKMGRISAIGWGAGYIGGLFSLGAALAYVHWAQRQGVPETTFVPYILLGCAALFGALSLPTFLVLRERAQPDPRVEAGDFVKTSFERLLVTLTHVRHYRDLFFILLAICVYTCGTATVVHLASVYAQETLKFTQQDSLIMILVVDLTAAIGAFSFGYIQDKIGSVRTLTATLIIWSIAVVVAYLAQTKWQLWISGNVVGLAMGATGSAGRALVGRFAPRGRSGEFLGLWGLAMKAASAIGVLAFGVVTYLSGGDLRLAMLSLVFFFMIGIVLVRCVNEERGVAAAQHPVPQK